MCSDLPGHISQTVPLRTLWACLLTLGSAWAGKEGGGDEWGVTNERKNNKKVTKTFYAALLEA